MRVWDVHPGYLSRESLLGQHVEIHAIFSVITGGKKGYAHHPETMRWRNNLGLLLKAHGYTVAEMELRGYGHRSPLPKPECPGGGTLGWVDPPHLQFGLLQEKYTPQKREGRIPLPRRGSQFWAHHKYAVMSRGYSCYKYIQSYLRDKEDSPVERDRELVASVLQILSSPMDAKALRNTLDHLWGYFKKEANSQERDCYLAKRETDPLSLLPFLYELACRYDLSCLRHSTIFADYQAG